MSLNTYVSGGVKEAQDIFGDVSDLLEEYAQRKRLPEDDAEDLDEELEDEDDEAAEERLRLKVRALAASHMLLTKCAARSLQNCLGELLRGPSK